MRQGVREAGSFSDRGSKRGRRLSEAGRAGVNEARSEG